MTKKVGIWGLGITGTSLIRYLSPQAYELGVMDKKQPTPEEHDFLKAHGVAFFPESNKEDFFATYEAIIPSGGIDLRPYPQHAHKWLSELDLFAENYNGRLVGITGSLGKTSVTHLLSAALAKAGQKVATGGNIGVGMMDLLNKPADITVLELSSFQLELSKKMAPDLAIITNIYPNHLDRHGTLTEYIQAKYAIIRYQKPHQTALIHADAYEHIQHFNPEARIILFSEKRPVHPFKTAYYFDNGRMIKEHQGNISVFDNELPSISFPLNWLIVAAAVDILGCTLPNFTDISVDLPRHRLQHVATVQDIDFIDDSKSTVCESTQAALDKLSSRPIILLMGGLGKGVDREPFIKHNASRIKVAHFFGKEAEQLHAHAQRHGLPSYAHKTLDDAFAGALKSAQVSDQILLSPAGSSYDLFSDYQERGNAFQKLVARYNAQH